MRRQLRYAAVAMITLAAGCSGGGYTIEVLFDPSTLADDAVSVEVAIISSCLGQGIGEPVVSPLRSIVVRRGSMSGPLADLDPGTYALYGRASDATCTVTAAACTPITVEAGGSGTLTITLAAVMGPGCPSGSACVAGECSMDGDAGLCTLCDDGDDCTDDRCEGTTCTNTTRDLDGDGHGDATCAAVGGVPADDCDDGDPNASPEEDERCNGVDDDCDGTIDDGFDCVMGSTEACAFCGFGTQTCDASCTLGPCAATDADTVATWTFDAEPIPSAFTDETGTHPGTIVGGDITWGSGPFGCGDAFESSGTDMIYGEVANSSEFELTSGSLSVWAFFTADGAQGVVSRDANGKTMPGHLTLSRGGSGAMRARIQTSAGEITRCTSAAVDTDRWIELEVRWGAPGFELLVDGVRAASCTIGDVMEGITGNMNPWVIGVSNQTSVEGTSMPVSEPMSGRIDHLRLRRGRGDPAAPTVTALSLIDATTGETLGALGTGSVIELATFTDISVRASTDPGIVAMVVFDLDATTGHRTAAAPPYLIEPGGTALTLTPGPHLIRATAFGTAGMPGTPREIRVIVR